MEYIIFIVGLAVVGYIVYRYGELRFEDGYGEGHDDGFILAGKLSEVKTKVCSLIGKKKTPKKAPKKVVKKKK